MHSIDLQIKKSGNVVKEFVMLTENEKDADLIKAEEEKEEEKDEEQATSESEGEKMKKEKDMNKAVKTEITEEDLQKSLDQLEAVTTENDAPTRKQQLLEKAQTEDLEKSERDELFSLMGGELPVAKEEENLSDQLDKSMEASDELQKALDVSDYLEEQHNGLKESLGLIAKHIEKSDARQHEFNLILAQAVTRIGQLVKSLAGQVDDSLSQPVRAPKAKGTPKPLEKSFADQPTGEEKISKAELLEGLNGLIRKSVDSGMGGGTSDGINLLLEASKLESTNSMSPQAHALVVKYIKEQKVSH
jgi:hypothetical protein